MTQGTNFAPLLTDLFLHSNEVDLIADLIQKEEPCLAIFFDLSFRNIDDVLSLNNPSFWDFIHHNNLKELEIKDSTDTVDPTQVPYATRLYLGKFPTKAAEAFVLPQG